MSALKSTLTVLEIKERLDLELDAPKGDIFKWYWDNVENDKTINYYSYLKGLRVSDLKD